MMRFAMGLVLIAGMVGAALGQDAAKSPDAAVKVRKLTLVATDLPNADWRTAAASLEGGTYGVEDLQERIQQKLRDEGYYFAHAENPQLTNVRQEGAGRSADAAVTIEAGNQYTMGEITFKRTTQFKNEQMRSQFPIAAGSVFNGSAVSAGLEKLKALYEAQGFADVGAVPSMAVNEARHVIDISAVLIWATDAGRRGANSRRRKNAAGGVEGTRGETLQPGFVEEVAGRERSQVGEGRAGAASAGRGHCRYGSAFDECAADFSVAELAALLCALDHLDHRQCFAIVERYGDALDLDIALEAVERHAGERGAHLEAPEACFARGIFDCG
jgi:hypothetical protein